MNDIIITRVGIIGAAPHKYLDLFLHPKVKKVHYFYFDNEEENYKALAEIYSRHRLELNTDFSGRKFRWFSFFTKYAQSIKDLETFFSLIPNEMLRVITQEFTKSDILIIGDNDYDGSFALASICSLLGIPYVLTFKETRFRQNDILERLAIEGATKIVVPHQGYIDLLKEKHGINISKKAIFADVDWRSRFIFDKYICGKQVQKLSEKDGRFHVCILSSRAIWDPKETRSSGRYYYVEIIEKLLKAGFIVHLHTRIIIKSLDEPILARENPYTRLEKQYPNRFFIEEHIDLRKPEGYYELMKYDLGLLTSGKIEDSTFMEFEQYNIPNRYYEYKHAGLIPIAPAGVLKYLEKNSEDTIFFNDPLEIYEKLPKIDGLRITFHENLIKKIINNFFLEPSTSHNNDDEYHAGFNLRYREIYIKSSDSIKK